MAVDKEYIKELVAVLPDSPGVYQYFNESGLLIYVGKAKNLKKRVSSYFTKTHDSVKTLILVRQIADIKHIVVETEEDALLLENNLIKKHKPRYNVLLKDDKTYPWICIKNEAFPRVFSTRNLIKDGSQYFGPYTSLYLVKTLLEFMRQLYKLRTCSLNLSPEVIAKGRYKVCLEYHIGNCKGPCIGQQTEDEYRGFIAGIKDILKGNTQKVVKAFRENMMQLASELKFEEANIVKQQLQLIENYQSKSTVVSPTVNNVDVFCILDDTDTAFVNFFKVMNGAIIQSHTLEIKKRLDETKEELLGMAITEIRRKIFSTSRELIVPFEPDFAPENVQFTIPKAGDKYELLQLAQRNLMYYKSEKMKQLERVDPERHTNRLLETLQRDLQLSEPPRHIECFDNSNIQGHHAVSACVVFKDARPSKKDYRHFNIKTVEGPNDFASMEEVLRRRYTRLIEENEPLPQLIVIDGGKGQLSAAVSILTQLNIIDKVTVIGIAKRLEEIFYPNDPIPLYLDKNSESLKVIQHLRNEAHRFGITHHRNKRSREFIKSELTTIQGIGEKTSELLLAELKSIENIKNASFEQLSLLVGAAKADILQKYFGSKSESAQESASEPL